jgi:hypothetical protein
VSVCAARATSDAVTCDVLLANGRYGCACRIAVEAEVKAAVDRQARVPDSAREAS